MLRSKPPRQTLVARLHYLLVLPSGVHRRRSVLVLVLMAALLLQRGVSASSCGRDHLVDAFGLLVFWSYRLFVSPRAYSSLRLLGHTQAPGCPPWALSTGISISTCAPPQRKYSYRTIHPSRVVYVRKVKPNPTYSSAVLYVYSSTVPLVQ